MRAAQISRIRVSANRPSRWTSTASETLSTESRLTAERWGIGSVPGSSTTSLASPRSVVVHGATSARLCRGIMASRDRTTTGRRPMSAISHHHTSPRAGSAITRRRLPVATTPGRPTRPARRPGVRRRRHNWRPPRRICAERAMLEVPRQQGRRRWPRYAGSAQYRAAPHPRSCSVVCDSCHEYATRYLRPTDERAVGELPPRGRVLRSAGRDGREGGAPGARRAPPASWSRRPSSRASVRRPCSPSSASPRRPSTSSQLPGW